MPPGGIQPGSRLAASVLAAAACAAACSQPLPPPGGQALPTPDGVRATLYRYTRAPAPRRRAILLLPDVGMTHHAFDHGGRGLARYLFAHGQEVLVLEYRGAGRSDVPTGGYTLSELLENDAEAALEAALDEHEAVVVVGCGLGGTLAMALAARHPHAVPRVVGLQAAATLDVPNEPLAELLSRADALPPLSDLARASAAPLFPGRSWFEVMLANDGSTAAAEREGLRRALLAPVPRALVQELARAASSRRIELGGRDVREAVRGYPGRVLLLFAPRDNFIHPEFSTPWRDVLDPAQVRVKVLSAIEGARRDYGHLGMLFAASAEEDVFAPVLEFAAKGGAP